MARCNKCGKKGFFINLNSNGMCQDCERIDLLESKEESLKQSIEKLNTELANKEKQRLDNTKNQKVSIDKFINKAEPIKKLIEIVTAIAGVFIAIYFLFSSLYEVQVINYYKLDISLFDPNTNELIVVIISILAAAAIIIILGTIIYCITIKKVDNSDTTSNKMTTVLYNLLGIIICVPVLSTNKLNVTVEVKYVFMLFILIFIYNIMATVFRIGVTDIKNSLIIKVATGLRFETKKNAIITVSFFIACIFAMIVNGNNEDIMNKKKFVTFTSKSNREAFIIKKFKDNYIASYYNKLSNKKEAGYFVIDTKDGYVFQEKELGKMNVSK